MRKRKEIGSNFVQELIPENLTLEAENSEEKDNHAHKKPIPKICDSQEEVFPSDILIPVESSQGNPQEFLERNGASTLAGVRRKFEETLQPASEYAEAEMWLRKISLLHQILNTVCNMLLEPKTLRKYFHCRDPI